MIDEPVRGRLPDPGFWSLPGIEQARARLRGLVPRSPLSHLIGLRLTQVGAGSATVTMPASPWTQSADGAIEERILLEAALALAVTTGAPAAHSVSTTALSVHELRLSQLDSETLVARARTLNSGSLFTFAEVLVEDAAGRTVSHATGSFLIRPIDPPPPPFAAVAEPVEEPTYPSPDPYLRPVTGRFFYEGWAEEDGLSLIRRFRAGGIPVAPVIELLGARLVEADRETISVTLTTSEWHCGLSREVSPGVIATLAHFALGGAAVTVAEAGQWVGTLEQSFTLLRPVPPVGRQLLSTGRVIHQAGDLVVCTAEVTDEDGNRVALSYQTGVVRQRSSRRRSTDPVRILATVVFTDIVGSTEAADRLGDARWSALLDEHHAAVRQKFELFKGREVKTTGDGFLATFDSPGRAVQAARAVRDAVRRLGLEIRVGVHTGECESSGPDVAGIAVHIAARVQGLAGAGEVLVTSTVRDLVTGSGLRFRDRGRHQLKGVEGDWQLFALEE